MTSLDEIAILNPPATYLMRAGGDSMTGVGIYPHDIIVVDRSLRAKHRSIVTAIYDGEFVCKRLLEAESSIVLLAPENPAYPPIVIPNPEDLVIWGYALSTCTTCDGNERSPCICAVRRQQLLLLRRVRMAS